jgi:hypothetical protein
VPCTTNIFTELVILWDIRLACLSLSATSAQACPDTQHNGILLDDTQHNNDNK